MANKALERLRKTKQNLLHPVEKAARTEEWRTQGMLLGDRGAVCLPRWWWCCWVAGQSLPLRVYVKGREKARMHSRLHQGSCNLMKLILHTHQWLRAIPRQQGQSNLMKQENTGVPDTEMKGDECISTEWNFECRDLSLSSLGCT